ncbi:MAG: papain-like cysteine protease family protein, partial [Pseudonocardiaceae bacterium]
GHPTAEVEGVTRQSERTEIREDAKRQGAHPGSYGVRQKLKPFPSRGLKQDEFDQLAGHNGLTAPLLPPRDTKAATGGWTSAQLESLMRIHGPLWCAFGYGHIVVLKGIDDQGQAIVHDPQGKPDTPYPMGNFNNLLTWQPNGVMYLPAVPNQAAYDPT